MTPARQQATMDFRSPDEPSEETEEEEETTEQNEEDPRHDHHADLNELFGEEDPYYDPIAKYFARVLRLKHNVAYLQRQRGEAETEPPIDTSKTLHEQAHTLATLTRGCILQRTRGLSKVPELAWTYRLDKESEQRLMHNVQEMIQALRQKVEDLKEE